MSKRIKGFVICALCCLVLTGCNDVIDLTDEQSTLIAEYAAQLLLKYDLNYEDRIEEGERDAEELEEETSEMMLTSEEGEQPVTTEILTTQENTETVSDIADEEMKEEHAVGTEEDIAKILGISNVSITYKDYIVTEQYPVTDDDGDFMHLEASDGYQLLVVRFNVVNTTEDMAEISLMDSSINYRLVCNGSKAANPMLTILMNDLGTLETSVKPGENQEAVLVFQISDDMKDMLDTIELKINYNDTDNVINVK
ncbi:MAG: DUF4352 domain-containing protein [Clostridiales bacterium]|nr:DUF4352 domain-containing protein [Clostridiales bacterium]